MVKKHHVIISGILFMMGFVWFLASPSLRSGDVSVYVTGESPSIVTVSSGYWESDKEFRPPANSEVHISPLLYGVYTVNLSFPTGDLELTFYHQNASDKELITVEVQSASFAKVTLHTEDDLVYSETVMLSTQETALTLSWI